MFEDVRSVLKFNRISRSLLSEEHRVIEQKFFHMKALKYKLLFEPGE
jgi:hypothetical protein